MSITVSFLLDEDFNEDDLIVMLKYRNLAIAVSQIKYRLMRIGRGKEWSDRPEYVTSDQMLEYIEKMVQEITEELPDLTHY